MSRPIFRIFLSSTFGDFQAEREQLRSQVWPRLKAHCAAHGASFQVVDLRWGISPAVASSHDTIRICLDEVKRCQEISPFPKPNFIMLIGDRYGWRPPAAEIPDGDFRLMTEFLQKDDASFFSSWYRRDDNAVPPVWILKPREGEYASRETWAFVEKRLVTLQHSAATKFNLAPERYLYSATHMEIVDGLFKLKGICSHIFSFNRELEGLPATSAGGITHKFADYLPDGSRDWEAGELLKLLKGEISNTLPDCQIHRFRADWLGSDDTPISTSHLKHLCSDVEQALYSVIKPELEQITAKTPLDEELELQRQFLKETGKLLIGRDRELTEIRSYLNKKKSPYPLIIKATGGCGKSTLMAKAIMEGGEASIYRFVGATPRSWHPLTFLKDMIVQIAEAYNQEPPFHPEEGGITKVAKLLHHQMEMATAERPLMFFIDAIDQFSDTTPGTYADILPRQLPPYVKMVISVLDGQDAEQVVRLYPKGPIIQLEPLSPLACGKILDALLQGRKLTRKQRAGILNRAKVSGLPLWLTLATLTARRLKSWDDVPNLPPNIRDLTRHIISQIAQIHGQAITHASLRYIKLARFGLSESELLDILWADPAVRAEFDSIKNPDQPEVTGLPPIIWSRLYTDLDPYINEFWMDGHLLYRYFHRVFGEVVDELDQTARKSIHTYLAEYFEQQPLYLFTRPYEEAQGKGIDSHPNGRKLMELPYHLALADRIATSRETITVFDFAMAKCCLNRSDDWIDDFRRITEGEKTFNYQIWEHFVNSNSHILRRGNNDWPAHKILLQLAIEHADDSPVTIEAEKYLQQGICDWPWLRRELRAKHARIGNCLMVIEGHTNGIEGIHLLDNRRVLSWGDEVLRLWDLEKGTCLASFEGHTDIVDQVLIISNGRVLSCSFDDTMRLWDLESGACLSVIKNVVHVYQRSDGFVLYGDTNRRLWDLNNSTCLAITDDHVRGVRFLCNGRMLSWFTRGATMCLWDVEKGVCLGTFVGHSEDIKGVHVLPDERALSWGHDTHLCLWDLEKCCCIVVMRGHTEMIMYVLLLNDGRALSCSFDAEMRLWDLGNGKCLQILKGHEGSVDGAVDLPNGRVLSWSRDCTLRQWDLDTGECQTVMRGHTHFVTGVHLLTDERALSWSEDHSLRLWNLQNGECLRVFTGHSDYINGVQIHPSGRIISWADDNTLRMWDVDNSEATVLPEGHRPSYFIDCHLLNGNQALTTGSDPIPRLWDLETGRCIGLFMGHQHTIKDFKLISDQRGLSWSYGGDLLRLWDLKKRRCLSVMRGHIREISGVHQISKDRALSWSADRTLILWDLVKGAPIVYMSGHQSWIKGVHLLPDERILSWSNDYTLRLWYLNTGACLAIMEGHTDSINGIQLLNNDRVLSWSEDTTLRLWDLDNGKCIRVFNRHTKGVVGVHILFNNQALSWSRDTTLLLWDLENGECLRAFEGHSGAVENVHLLNGNRVLSSAHRFSGDFNLRLWDLESGRCMAIMAGHTKAIEVVHLLPEGCALSGSEDSTLRLWNVESGRCLEIYDRKNVFSAPKIVWQTFLGNDRITDTTGIDSYEKFLIIGHEQADNSDLLYWHSDSKCYARHIFDDGRVLTTLQNGQVCLLKLYDGSDRKTFDAVI